MAASERVRAGDFRAIFRLAGECRDLGDDPVAWRVHFFAGLAQLVGAGLVVGGEKGGVGSGTGTTLGTAAWGFENGFDPAGWERSVEAYARDPDYSPVEVRYLARLAGGGGPALARSDLMADPEWYASTDYREIVRLVGIDHLIWCYQPVGPAGDVSAVLLGRAGGDRDFTARQKAVVAEAHALVAPLVGGPLARFADPSPAALPPRVRQVLKCLLEGDSDKQVAARLDIRPHTVNQYVKTIFAHFGVRSRPELLARWVRRGWGRRLAWADDV